MKDIEDIADIKLFVDEFYAKVRRDELIGPVFSAVITGDWQPHLDKMYAFWNAALFSVPGFKEIRLPNMRHCKSRRSILIVGWSYFLQQ